MNNFTNNRWLTVVTLLLLTANIITLALLWTTKNEDRGNMRPAPGGQVFEFLTKELKLDEQQQETYKKLRDEHQQHDNRETPCFGDDRDTRRPTEVD